MPIRILHLEPNLSDAALTLLTLKTAFPDCSVERIVSLKEFEEELEDNGFDVVISEYQLSDGTADKALKLLRRHRPSVPFIVLSAVRETAVALKMLEKGAADYVFKEHRQHLPSAIQEALQRVATLRQTTPAPSAPSPSAPAAPLTSAPTATSDELLSSTLTTTPAKSAPSMQTAAPVEPTASAPAVPSPELPSSAPAASQPEPPISPISENAPLASTLTENQSAPAFVDEPDAADSPLVAAPPESPFLESESADTDSPAPSIEDAAVQTQTAVQSPFLDEETIPTVSAEDKESDATPVQPILEAHDVKSEAEVTAPEKPSEVAQKEIVDFRAIVEQLSDAILLIDPQGTICYASPAAEKIFECALSELSGKNFLELVHPDDRPALRDRLDECIEHPAQTFTNSLELRLLRSGSTPRVISVRERNELHNPMVRAIILTVREITERRHQSEMRKMQSRVLELIASSAPLSEVMSELCLSIERYLPDLQCSVHLVERGALRLVAAPNLPDDFAKEIDGMDIGMHRCTFGTAAHLKTRVTSENLQTDPLWEAYPQLVQNFGIAACWSQPIFDNARKVLGVLTLYSNEPHRPDSLEVEFIEAAAKVAALAIERTEMQEQLRWSEERLRRTIDTAPIGIFTCWLNGRFSDVNPAFCAMLGYSAEELLEMTFQDITHPDDLAISVEQDNKLLSGEIDHYTLVKRYLHKNGEPVNVRVQVGLAKNADGSPAYFVAEVEDITEALHTAKALEESNAKLSMILDNINDGVYRFRVYANRKFEYDFFSPSCEKVFGFTVEEMQRDKFLWINHVHEEDRENIWQESLKKIFEGKTAAVEYRFWRKDGELRWLSATLSPSFEAEQNCWLVVGVTRDITERKMSELALAQSEEQYRALVSSSKDGVYLVQEMKFVFVNGAFLNMLGYAREEVIGRSCLEVIASEYHAKIEEISAAFQQGRLKASDFEVELICKNGERILVIATLAATIYLGKRAATGTVKDITEKKRFEEALRQSEAELKAIFNSVPYSLLLLDCNYHVRAFNLQAIQDSQRLYGQPLRIGESVLSLVKEERQLPLSRKYLDAALQGEHVHFETTVTDGAETHCYEVRITPVRDANKTIMGICVVLGDISERKAAEEQLRFQARVLYEMKEAVIAVDATGRVKYCNRAAELFHGKSLQEMLGVRSEVIMRYRYPTKQIYHAAKIALEQEGHWQGDVIYLSHHSGKERVVSLSLAKLYGSEQKPSGLLCVLEDVTEVRQAELELKKSQEQLREIIENMPIVLFALNTSGVFSLVLGKGLEPLGYDAASLVGKSVYQLFSQNTVFLQDIGRAMSGEKFNHSAHFDDVFFDYHLSPMYDDKQKIIGVLGVAIDRTERYRAELERERLQEQLIQAQKMEAIGTLTGGIAHDFNNLLTAILGNLELIKMHGIQNAAVQKPLERAEVAANRAAVLTQQLLAFARQDKFTSKRIALNQVVLNALEILEHTIDKRIKIHKELTPDLPEIYGDLTQLQQVIINLTLNACDAFPKHLLESGNACITFATSRAQDESVRARAALDKNKNYVHLKVSDNGIGIPKELQAKVFEPFFTTKEVGKGTGLGLSIVYGIIKKHQGLIEVESEAGKGTTFHIYLPVADFTAELKD
ncbi:MAG: PAS domain S-box protein [Candidatus Thermochlorobacter sp.]